MHYKISTQNMSLDIADKSYIETVITSSITKNNEVLFGRIRAEFHIEGESLSNRFKKEGDNLLEHLKKENSQNMLILKKEGDSLFERLRKENHHDMTVFKDEIKKDITHNMGALNEAFQEKLDKVIELVKDRPTRSEVRETVRTIVKEESRPIVQEEIHKLVFPYFVSMRTEIQSVRNELRDEIRNVTRNHEKRIGRLEAATAH